MYNPPGMLTANACYILEICAAGESEASLPLLSPAELRVYRALKTSKRRLDWLSGRAAAKRALGRFFEDSGTPTPLDEIEIFNDDAGRPHCRAPQAAPSFSISHNALGGLCAVRVPDYGNGRPGPLPRTRDVALTGRIGADWELISRRDAGVLGLAFHESERTPELLGSPSEQTRLWTLKEAVLKFIGTGLLCSPHDVRFVPHHLSIGSGRPGPLPPPSSVIGRGGPIQYEGRGPRTRDVGGSLKLEGKALKTWAALGKPAIRTESFARPDGSIISLAYC